MYNESRSNSHFYPKELDLDVLEKRGINKFEAVILAAKEARYINAMNKKDGIKPKLIPTSEAIQNLFDGKIDKNYTNENDI